MSALEAGENLSAAGRGYDVDEKQGAEENHA
jgi:hypothetical protein